MPILAIVLLLVAASLHALWNLLLKRSQEKYIAMGWQVIISGIFALFLLLFTGFPPRSMWLFALISMALEAIYFVLLSNAYSDHDFSLVYPIARGAAPGFLMLWSVLFLHEKLTVGGALGVGMIVCGMAIIGATSLIQSRGSRLHLKGVLVALSVALIISLYTLIDGTAVKNGPPLPYALTMFMLVPILTTTYNIRRFGWKPFVGSLEGTAHSSDPRGCAWCGCLLAYPGHLYLRPIKLFRRHPGGECGHRRVPGLAVPGGTDGRHARAWLHYHFCRDIDYRDFWVKM